MAATLTGTPVAINWAAGANPAGQSVTIPSDATAVYMFWAYDGIDANGHGLASATLNGASPSQTFEIPTAAGFYPATGVAAWYNPATGSQTLDPAWDIAPVEGPVTIVAFVKGGSTTAWRDADADQDITTTAVTVTLTTVSGDLVIKFDQRYDALENVPSLSAGWTNGATGGNVDEGCRLSYISATGTTQVCNSEDESYSSIVAISIPEAATGYTIAADGGSFALTGDASNLEFGRLVGANAGSYTLTGADVTLTYTPIGNYSITADGGSYTLTGDASNLEFGRLLSAEAGAYTLTGADALRDLSMVALGGSYTLTGADVTLTYNGSGATLTAEAGVFTLTGADANLEFGRLVGAEGGTFSLAGTDASLERGWTITADAGSYTYSGTDASLEFGRAVAADGGAYVLTGADATLTYFNGYFLTAEAGSYALDGNAAGLRFSGEDQQGSGGWPMPPRRKRRKEEREEQVEPVEAEEPVTVMAQALKKARIAPSNFVERETELAAKQIAAEFIAKQKALPAVQKPAINWQQRADEEKAVLLILASLRKSRQPA